MMNKRLLYLLITLIGFFSVSLVGHFSGYGSGHSSTKVHPTYKTSITSYSCIDESETNTSDFEKSDNHNDHAYEIGSFDYSFYYEDFRLIPTSFLNSFGRLFSNSIPIYLIFQNFRI